MIEHDLSIVKPDYDGGSIVNLMTSLGDALGVPASEYPALGCLPDARLREARRIVMLVIDGLGEELLRHIGADSALARLHAGTMTSVYPPTTATAITTFMTGQAPQQHGLTGWFMHFRKLGAVTAVLPFCARYEGEPLSRRGIDIADLIDCPSFFDRIECDSVALMPAFIADSDFSRLLGGRARRVAFGGLDDFARQLAGYCRGEHDEHYVYAYWPELDRLAHAHGPSSPEVAAHFRDLDAALAPVIDACANSGTLFIATADHGFIDSGEEERIDLEGHPALADTLSLPLSGEPRSAYCYVQASRLSQFEAYLRAEFAPYAVAVPSEDMVAAGWFGRGRPHPELGARIGDFTLQMKECYTIRDLVTGEANGRMQGMHGGVAAAEQYVPLLIAGP